MQSGEIDRLSSLVKLIRAETKERGMPPTIRELGQSQGRSVAVVHADLRVLREQGRVEWEDNRPRTLKVVRGKR